MVENVSRIKSGMTISVPASVKFLKNIICAKQYTFGILLHVVAKMLEYY